MTIPIVIISFDNFKYVQNTINSIPKLYQQGIIILDNNSTDKRTIEYLKSVPFRVVYNKENIGPWCCRNYTENKMLYESLPDKFILTDPDLQFNPNLPENFIDILVDLSDQLMCEKIGFALDISDYNNMLPSPQYCGGKSIKEWEEGFWQKNLPSINCLELYDAAIDTTFHVYNKLGNGHVRVAGNFTAKHIPWYIDNSFYSFGERLRLYKNSKFSTIYSTFSDYVHEHFISVSKKSIKLLIQKGDTNINFWTGHFNYDWENETFDVLDQFLSTEKVFIDIGSWIGPITLYATSLSKRVIAVDADIQSIKDLESNCKVNSNGNVAIINKAIYNKSGAKVNFGKNRFLGNSKLNDSTSQILDSLSLDAYEIETITLEELIANNNLVPSDISIIKVDIEGGEENILQDIFDFSSKHNVRAYVSFHYSWWSDKNLNRFVFLSQQHKLQIANDPFSSILF
uniref:Methyltransferase FkbM domain-containing protein n=1 Tax=viral metagenome TaxID=1070528 RepID=A0A6C0KUL4_9ZZZZ